jgi:hypothetical protein
VSSPRLNALLLACVALPAALLAGCGGGGGGSDADVGPAAAVPANTPIYLDATVKPTGTAKTNAEDALKTILHTNDPATQVIAQIDKQKTSTGQPVNYQTDIAPWLGEKAGVFFTTLGQNSQGASVVETTNPSAALAFAQKANGTSGQPKNVDGVSVQTAQDGTTAYATEGNFLFVGDEAGVEAAIKADKGDSLGDDSDFKDSIGDLPSDRLGTLYTVPKNFIDALGSQFGAQSRAAIEQSSGQNLDEPVAGALTASGDKVQLEAKGGSTGLDTPESSLIADVPGQSWVALGVGNLGDTLKKELDQLKDQIPNFDSVVQQIQSTTGSSLEQLTASLGDAVIYVQGTTQQTLTGALIVQSKDTELTGRLLSQFQGLLQLGSSGVKPLHLSGGGSGFQINDPSVAPRPVEVAQQGDKIVIGYGAGSAEASLTPAQTLSDSPTFSTAHDQISSLGTDLFVDLKSVFALAESSGAKSDPSYVQAKPYLDALSYVVTGSGSSGDQADFKAILGLK